MDFYSFDYEEYVEIGECVICGKKFYKDKSSRVTCNSPECKKARAKLKSAERFEKTSETHCKRCGKKIEVYTKHNQIYCGQQCRALELKEYLKAKEYKKKCRRCGKEFMAHHPTVKFCCEEHRLQHYKLQRMRKRRVG